MNLCSEADAFVAALPTALPFHAKTAFLLLGPMLDIKARLAMYSIVLSKKGIISIIIAVPVFVFLVSLAIYYLGGVL
ncbi:MAG: hypothetical protein U5N86_03540 [Planctomycetota bacterium]|nr:hypothetical protein [Planctomycetota bacterium]